MTSKKQEGNILISLTDPCYFKEFDFILNCKDRVLIFGSANTPIFSSGSCEWFTGDHVIQEV